MTPKEKHKQYNLRNVLKIQYLLELMILLVPRSSQMSSNRSEKDALEMTLSLLSQVTLLCLNGWWKLLNLVNEYARVMAVTLVLQVILLCLNGRWKLSKLLDKNALEMAVTLVVLLVILLCLNGRWKLLNLRDKNALEIVEKAARLYLKRNSEELENYLHFFLRIITAKS